jgi:hypothetical protein
MAANKVAGVMVEFEYRSCVLYRCSEMPLETETFDH